jgi:hypothetical protein
MAEVLNRLLSGNLSSQSGGFLVRMPDGMVGRRLLQAAMDDTYGPAHPDLRILDPEGRTIAVDDVRNLRDFLGTSPMGRGMKTLLVIAADRMNVQAANAFLKTLEEPSRHTRIILSTDCPWTLPATVLSRCHKLSMRADAEDLAAEVQSNFEDKLSPEDVTAALDLSSGNPKAAADILKHDLKDWHQSVRKWLSSPVGAQPKPPGAGKESPSLETLFRILQRDIMKSASSEDGIPGWSSARAEQASVILNEMGRGISRPGIDWKNRLFATLSCLAHMETVD